ncbi:ornithine cyclodeaminase family protein [Tateyamaria sp. Alg231-49]|uniref:ornithine cyclodeaminase family protein n=1 Tax=Tateyamaria sp. Alg231-49 TaxID=1922219 RepID=UPI000D55FC30|nr:ornithine cyclodeaminase [Tateyamaria sp. Alg231-49]
MNPPVIPFDQGDTLLDWLGLTDALAAGHSLPKAEIGDTFLYRNPDTLLSRAAWIDGLGMAVKTATIFPQNTEKPTINGGVSLYSDSDGTLDAIIDFHLVTKWKTAGDSLLAALHLAPAKPQRILIVGAGTVAASVHAAFGAGFPDAAFGLWNRSPQRAAEFSKAHPDVTVEPDLETAVRNADIVIGCTMATTPWLCGDWLRPGQHVNLIGAYRPDMREVDDTTLLQSRVYVDSFDTTVGHIGEVKIPLETGTIAREHLLADYYDLPSFKPATDDITLFKNGGGAHLDLMTSRYILDRWRAR